MTTLPEKTDKKLGLVIDLDICVGCHACAVSCKEWNTGGYGAVFRTSALQRPPRLGRATPVRRQVAG